MRTAGARLKKMYGTQIGQDTIETLVGGAVAAGGQALFTDMTPEEIAIATVLGMGAATVGRPLGGRIGQAVGNKAANSRPELNELAREMINPKGISPAMKEAMAIKFAPYSHLQPAAQVGQVLGRSQGDNIVQGLVALGAPFVVGGDENV